MNVVTDDLKNCSVFIDFMHVAKKINGNFHIRTLYKYFL